MQKKDLHDSDLNSKPVIQVPTSFLQGWATVLQALKSTKYSALVLDCESCGLKKSELVESACQMVIQWLVINFKFLILALCLVYK